MGEPLEVLEGSDCEISRLFPKCRLNTGLDLNLNRVSFDANENFTIQSYDEVTAPVTLHSSRMSIDTASATSSSPGSHSTSSGNRNQSTPPYYDEKRLESTYDGQQQPTYDLHLQKQTKRLKDSRIEAAGGREVFSQSRSRPTRRRYDRPHQYFCHNSIPNQIPRRLHVTGMESSSSRSDTTSSGAESSNSSFDEVSSESVPNESLKTNKREQSPVVYETPLAGSSEVVFDDIGEWVNRGLKMKSYPADKDKCLGSYSRSQSERESDTEDQSSSVKKIGNVPIAEYEGSPRRYGTRKIYHHSPKSLYLLPPNHRAPRPGFPRRIITNDKKHKESNNIPWERQYTREKYIKDKPREKKLHRSRLRTKIKQESSKPEKIHSSDTTFYNDKHMNMDSTNLDGIYTQTIEPVPSECSEVQPPVISISTLSSAYSQRDWDPQAEHPLANFDLESSETRKVLEDFFRDPNQKLSKQDFLDLEYTLKRQQGSSYVGQRLAGGEKDDDEEEEEEEAEPRKIDGEVELNGQDIEVSVKQYNQFTSIYQQQLSASASSTSSMSCTEKLSDLDALKPDCSNDCTPQPIKEEVPSDTISDTLNSTNLSALTDKLLEHCEKLDSSFNNVDACDNLTNESDRLSCDKLIDHCNQSAPEVDQVHEQFRSWNDKNLLYESVDLLTEESVECMIDSTPVDDNQAQMECSRNLTLSPTTTTCGSVEAESEYSGGEMQEGSIHSSTRGPCPIMPILEDGLSSGEESYTKVKLHEKPIYENGINHVSEKMEYERTPLPPDGLEQGMEIDRTNERTNGQHIDGHRIDMSYQRRYDEHLCRGDITRLINDAANMNEMGQLVPDSYDCDTYAQHSPSSSTLSLMKKQITEIEREIALKKPDMRRFDGEMPPLDLHMLDPLAEKICEPPPPPAPHPHRDDDDVCISGSTSDFSTVLHSPQLTPGPCSVSGPQLLSAMGSISSPVQSHMLPSHCSSQDYYSKSGTNMSPSRESVEAAIADIKQAIRRTKNLSLKSHSQERQVSDKGPVWVPRGRRDYERSDESSPSQNANPDNESQCGDRSRDRSEEDGDTDQETDRLLGRQRSRDTGYLEEKSWRKSKNSRCIQKYIAPNLKDADNEDAPNSTGTANSPVMTETPDTESPDKKKDKDKTKKKGRSKEVLIEGVLFRARYLGSTQLVSEGQPTKTTRMMQAEEAVSRIKALAPEGEPQPTTEVDLFISTEKIMVLNTDLKEIMMDHALRTISYIADIGDLVVLMARRRVLPTEDPAADGSHKTPKMICHVFESDEAQFIAQSIGQAFQVAYLEFLKANGIEDHSFVKEMDYQEVLNSQEIFGDELQMFAKKELQKEVVVPKLKSEILGVVVVESGWGSMVPTVVIANLSPNGAAAKCGQMNIGDQIIAINGISLVGLPLSTCQNYIKNTKYNTAVKLTVVPCPPVVEVKIRRPDTKYQLGFSVQNGVICSLLRGGIAERGGVRVGHRIIDINSQSVVAVPHEKIVNLLATSVGEIRMKTMPTSIFRLLTGQETPQYI